MEEYSVFYKPKAEKDFKKHLRKNAHQSRIICKKLEQMRQNPYSYGEQLRDRLKGYYSIHIDSHFVLLYSVDEENRRIYVERYDKHDKAYKI